jgi:hypothetical protein
MPGNGTPALEKPADHHGAARWAILLLGLALLAYSTLRAITVSFSWDESWTWVHHVSKNMFYQQAYDKMGGNHHLLNVWLMWICHKLFGDGALSLRLPSLMAHAIYLYASGRMALKARSGLLAVAVFLLLNLHPYLLDFFSLARGYGLACGWMMLSLLQAWRYLGKNGSSRQLLWSAAFAALAAMSHVIMINFLLALGLSYLLIMVLEAARGYTVAWRSDLIALCIPSAVGLALILPNALGLFHGGSLNFGCDTFWNCMVRTLGEKVLYHRPYAWPVLRIMAWGISSIALVCLITFIAAWRGGWTSRCGPMAFGLLVLGACLFSFYMQQVLFDVPLPQTRTGLFLLPLLAFVLAGAFVAWPKPSLFPVTAAWLMCIPLVLHQYYSFNLKYAVEWKPSGEVAHMLGIIAKDHLPLSAERPVVTLCASFESWGCIPYYQRTRNMEWLVTTTRRPPDPYINSDYYIVEYDGYERVDTAHWTPLYRSEATNTTLYRDERWRVAKPTVLFHEVNDMERRDLPGGYGQIHVSGVQCIRFDSLTRSTDALRWVVPPGQDSLRVQLSGSGLVLQMDDSNWIAFVITVKRGDKEIGHADVSSALQTVRFGEWNKVGIMLYPDLALMPGDVVELTVWPLTSDTPLYLDDLELTVMH